MNKKEQWSSGIGFVMAAAGSAIGLGNIWKFPYMTGTNGGSVFLVMYIIFLVLLGIPILLSETSIGRYAGLNAVDSCNKIKKGWGFVGGIGIIGSFVILSAYNVVGGWVIKYIFVSGDDLNAEYFNRYISEPVQPIIWTFIFSAISTIIVIGGVSKGIEKVSSVLLPLLFIFLTIIMIYSLTLPNAIEGVKYFLIPDFSHIKSIGDFARIALNAMGQVFFSLSLGMGTLITYGSYLKKDTNMFKNTVTIVTLDTLIAIISGLLIIPAVFSFGLEITSGPGLIFETLPVVFSRMKFGNIIAPVFFILIFFAAVTSSISLLEVMVSWFSSKTNLSRTVSAIICSIAVFAVSTLASMSFNVLSGSAIGGMPIFDLLNFISDKIIMPIGGLFICILVGYVWGIKSASREISNEGTLKFRFEKIFNITIRYIAPALIIIIFITSLINM